MMSGWLACVWYVLGVQCSGISARCTVGSVLGVQCILAYIIMQ